MVSVFYEGIGLAILPNSRYNANNFYKIGPDVEEEKKSFVGLGEFRDMYVVFYSIIVSLFIVVFLSERCVVWILTTFDGNEI